jgi:hypothetical protein
MNNHRLEALFGNPYSPDGGRARDGGEYDLSFAYRFRWDSPETQIREALKVLLCNEIDVQSVKRPAEQGQQGQQGQQKESRKSVEAEAARIRWLLAINPNTPPPVLEHLSNDASLRLLERIAENPRTHTTTLAKLANHDEAQVRAAVAENMNISIKTAWKLARDESPDVRVRLAESYHVPVAILRILATDDNPYVQERAYKTLYRMLEEVQSLRSA